MSAPRARVAEDEPEAGVTSTALMPRGSPGILERGALMGASFERRASGKENPLSIVIEEPLDAVRAVIGGRLTLMFGTNSYLGLNFHPDCVRAAVEACRHYGTGSTASRVAAGNHRLHVDLEAEIAAFHGRSDATIFSSGFVANLGVIAGLARKGDAIFVDAYCHASIVDACRLSGAALSMFRHNDSDDLKRLFSQSKVPGPQTLVIVESLYSVHGDLGELRDVAAVTKRHGGVLIVDEAHALGVYGSHGRGVAEHLSVEADVDVIVGTFSKSVGVIGGYAVTNTPALRALRFMARPYLYTASLPPAIVAAAREAVRLIGEGSALREILWRNARALSAGINALGLRLCADPGPVGCIRMAGVRAGYEFWKALLDRGIYVNLLLPPATPDGEVVLRFSVSAAHTPEHIDAAIAVFGDVSRSIALM